VSEPQTEQARLVRALYDALSSRDRDAIRNFFVQGAAPDYEWVPNERDPEQRPRRGLEENMAALEELFEAFEELETEIRELIDAGDTIVAVVHHRARGRESGAPIEREEVHVWTFRDGRAIRLAEFPAKDEALAAAGIEG
jgi:ketosteroid isomerase-like protein